MLLDLHKDLYPDILNKAGEIHWVNIAFTCSRMRNIICGVKQKIEENPPEIDKNTFLNHISIVNVYTLRRALQFMENYDFISNLDKNELRVSLENAANIICNFTTKCKPLIVHKKSDLSIFTPPVVLDQFDLVIKTMNLYFKLFTFLEKKLDLDCREEISLYEKFLINCVDFLSAGCGSNLLYFVLSKLKKDHIRFFKPNTSDKLLDKMIKQKDINGLKLAHNLNYFNVKDIKYYFGWMLKLRLIDNTFMFAQGCCFGRSEQFDKEELKKIHKHIILELLKKSYIRRTLELISEFLKYRIDISKTRDAKFLKKIRKFLGINLRIVLDERKKNFKIIDDKNQKILYSGYLNQERKYYTNNGSSYGAGGVFPLLANGKADVFWMSPVKL